MPTNERLSRNITLADLFADTRRPPPAEFAERFKGKDIRNFLARYQEKGGKPTRLGHLLWQLVPVKIRKPATPRTRKARLFACGNSIFDLLEDLDTSSSLKVSLEATLEELDREYQSVQRYEKLLRLSRKEGTGRPPGRRKGPTSDSLILATLAYEFRRRFKSPCYTDVLRLVQAASPEKFPPTMTIDSLRQRIRRIPERKLRENHRPFLG